MMRCWLKFASVESLTVKSNDKAQLYVGFRLQRYTLTTSQPIVTYGMGLTPIITRMFLITIIFLYGVKVSVIIASTNGNLEATIEEMKLSCRRSGKSIITFYNFMVRLIAMGCLYSI